MHLVIALRELSNLCDSSSLKDNTLLLRRHASLYHVLVGVSIHFNFWIFSLMVIMRTQKFSKASSRRVKCGFEQIMTM